jgi:hypothetical protein
MIGILVDKNGDTVTVLERAVGNYIVMPTHDIERYEYSAILERYIPFYKTTRFDLVYSDFSEEFDFYYKIFQEV